MCTICTHMHLTGPQWYIPAGRYSQRPKSGFSLIFVLVPLILEGLGLQLQCTVVPSDRNQNSLFRHPPKQQYNTYRMSCLWANSWSDILSLRSHIASTYPIQFCNLKSKLLPRKFVLNHHLIPRYLTATCLPVVHRDSPLESALLNHVGCSQVDALPKDTEEQAIQSNSIH